MPSFLQNIPFYIIRLWSVLAHYFPPTFTDSWRQSRLLPVILSTLARDTPERVYACIPKSEDIAKDGYSNITYRQFLNAVDNAAWWLDEIFDEKGQGEVFTYMGPRDLRYGILLIAGIKTGRVIFLISPHMPPSTQAIIFSQIKCQTLLYDPSVKDRTEASKTAIPDISIFECPSQATWLDVTNSPAKPYVYEPSWTEAKDTVAAIFHTSGSTSTPKPVSYTNAAFVCCDSMFRLLTPQLTDRKLVGQKFFTMLPPMHISGLTVAVLVPLYRCTIYVCGPSTLISPSPSTVNTIIQSTRPHAVLLSPYVLTSLLTSSPETRSNLLTIPSSAGFAGSSLPQNVGHVLSQNLILRNAYGSTEAGPFPQFPHSRDTWEYLRFHDLLGVDFVPYLGSVADEGGEDDGKGPLGAEDLYELVIRAHKDPVMRSDFQIIFHTHPHLLERFSSRARASDTVFHSSDLWTPHPTIRGLWKWVGRTDDMISLSNGGKVFVSAVESAIKKVFEDEMKVSMGNEDVGEGSRDKRWRYRQVQIEVLVGGKEMDSPFVLVEYMSSISGTPSRGSGRLGVVESEGLNVGGQEERATCTTGIERLSDIDNPAALQELHRAMKRIVDKVNAMNSLSSKYTQIDSERRVVSHDERGKGLQFIRSEKGSVCRGKTFEKYAHLTRGLYSLNDVVIESTVQ
ncbi:hypothetical protein D9757_011887 [Collybiopsis confluens]|uniref:AMP-dependent synthetase/ligase domain-containing protein n=1 Tax=Collybiopsis confluens TaxID=2823264 RepID=A0A8H5G8B2_9AGAR|nr:hypothetical protein D9757_012898 [Collybiopsis confluens]KAF5366638.1 hypothetical protein D9757_011887 [Collybiopsis confluens]